MGVTLLVGLGYTFAPAFGAVDMVAVTHDAGGIAAGRLALGEGRASEIVAQNSNLVLHCGQRACPVAMKVSPRWPQLSQVDVAHMSRSALSASRCNSAT